MKTLLALLLLIPSLSWGETEFLKCFFDYEGKTEEEGRGKFRNLADHWKSLEPKYKRDLNGLVFPNGFSFTLDEKITTPKLSIPFNDYRENSDNKSNLVEPRGIEPLTSTLPA